MQDDFGEAGISGAVHRAEHHQVLAGTGASMAPGFESADSLRQSKSSSSYWATQGAKKEKDAA